MRGCAVGVSVARYYDPQTAQFLTRDPLEAITGSPYGYTAGDPLDGADPLGLLSCNLNPFNGSFWTHGNCLSETAQSDYDAANSWYHSSAVQNFLFGRGSASCGPQPVRDEVPFAPGEWEEAGAGLWQRLKSFFGDDTGAVGRGEPTPRSPTSAYGKAQVPSWVINEGYLPFEGETPAQSATRIMNDRYGGGNWSKGPGTEYNQIQKWVTRHFG